MPDLDPILHDGVAADPAGRTVSGLKMVFRSLSTTNYRVWSAGSLVSNIGTWMQRTAQDWLVLTGLTHHNAAAVGLVVALQFGPQLLLLPLTGFAADNLDRRRLLLATQTAMGLLALGLGILTLGGWVRLWQVDLFALALGCVSAFDAPARQTFVSELVPERDLPNAVALNSASFNAARMIGPAIAGSLIAVVGVGAIFLINAASYVAVLGSILMLRLGRGDARPRRKATRAGLAEGARYVWGRPDLRTVFVMLACIGTFGLNFPIFISAMSVMAFHVGAARYGLLTSMMAVGSVLGALFAASRVRPTVRLLTGAASVLGVGFGLAALMPGYWLFGLALVLVGVSAQTFTTSSNSFGQLSASAAVRGRVVAIFLAIAMGSAPIGAPLVGWISDTLGPRWALGLAALSGLVAAGIGLLYLGSGGSARLVAPLVARLRHRHATPRPAPLG